LYDYKAISCFPDDEFRKIILYSGKYSGGGPSIRAAAIPEILRKIKHSI